MDEGQNQFCPQTRTCLGTSSTVVGTSTMISLHVTIINCVSVDRQQSTLENQKNSVCYSLLVRPLRYARALATVTRCSVSLVKPDPCTRGEALVSSL